MNHTKIVELFINDEFDESGIEAISLVSRPAHDETWMAFNKNNQTIITDKFDDEEKLNPYIVVEDDFCNINKEIFELGEPYEKLINEGYDIVRVEKITPQAVHKMNEEKFTEINPNAESVLDKNQPYLVRYKYIGIRDPKNRTFCRQMLQAGKVYTITNFRIYKKGSILQNVDALLDNGEEINVDYIFKAPKVFTSSTNLGGYNLNKLKEMVREVLAEMESDDEVTADVALGMDETFDGRDNLTDTAGHQLDENK